MNFNTKKKRSKKEDIQNKINSRDFLYDTNLIYYKNGTTKNEDKSFETYLVNKKTKNLNHSTIPKQEDENKSKDNISNSFEIACKYMGPSHVEAEKLYNNNSILDNRSTTDDCNIKILKDNNRSNDYGKLNLSKYNDIQINNYSSLLNNTHNTIYINNKEKESIKINITNSSYLSNEPHQLKIKEVNRIPNDSSQIDENINKSLNSSIRSKSINSKLIKNFHHFNTAESEMYKIKNDEILEKVNKKLNEKHKKYVFNTNINGKMAKL